MHKFWSTHFAGAVIGLILALAIGVPLVSKYLPTATS